jgi:alginate O-acetyltransferase complex protein AlgI
MLFNSLEFLIFFPIVLAAYYALNHKYRWILLLLASYYFYMCWNYKYVVLLLFTTIVCYFAAIGIHKTKNKPFRIFLLLSCLSVYLGTLFFFKYFNFFSNSVNEAFARFNIFLNVPTYQYILPVGISFYTFQALSYTIDVYRGEIPPVYHFGKFALFKSFFPQLVAGPIERAPHLFPQFSQKVKFDYYNIRNGATQVVWGFFKKVVVADRLSEYVNIVYSDPSSFGGWQIILATFFFTFQIYCDFSGYSDIAVGTARMMGISLMTNFRRPYFSANIREFWQRWHISLSTWFRDYVYISLGGNRVVKWKWQTNIFITFLVSGLWHGANWTFIIWGALHGFYQVFGIWTKNIREKINSFIGLTKVPQLYKLVQIIVTFFLAFFAWIFFRANSFHDAMVVLKNMFVFTDTAQINLFRIPSDLYLAFISIVVLFFIEVYIERTKDFDAKLMSLKPIMKWTLMILFIISIFVFGIWEGVDFLYFQF